MKNWLDKYEPRSLDDVIGDKSLINDIDRFVKQFTYKKINVDKIKNANLLITGTNGIGKTLITNLVLQKYNLEKVVPELASLSVNRKTRQNRKPDKEVTCTNRTVRTYYHTVQNNKIMGITNKVALVIDDVSNFPMSKRKKH